MALQDIQAINPASLIDPATGAPYPYGSSGYLKAITPFLESQLASESERAANARGMFYSGPATADEIQAEEQLLGNITQQGAAQSVQEQELKQQEEFAQEEQRSQNQANADAARASAKAGAIQSAVGGTTQGLGTLGGLALINKMQGKGWLGGAPSTPGADMNGAGVLAPPNYSLDAPPPADYVTAPPTTTAPTLGGSASSADIAAAGGPTSPGGLSSLAPGAAGSPIPGYGTMLASAPAAYTGYHLGGAHDISGNRENLGNEVGGGVGGAAGMALGNTLLPGIGGPLGAGVGSWLGKNVGGEFQRQPIKAGLASLALGPIAGPLIAEIPGVNRFMADAGNWISKNLNPAHWF